jgi:hypothetical protein
MAVIELRIQPSPDSGKRNFWESSPNNRLDAMGQRSGKKAIFFSLEGFLREYSSAI